MLLSLPNNINSEKNYRIGDNESDLGILGQYSKEICLIWMAIGAIYETLRASINDLRFSRHNKQIKHIFQHIKSF